MPKRVTQDDLDASDERLQKAKRGKNADATRAASDEHAALRTAWREQEEAAGRRVGTVAVSEDGN